ncbi:Ribonuclease/ribotoxin [Thermothelomyces heterothallicus CBS 203.75]
MRNAIPTLTLALYAVATAATGSLEPRQGTDSLSSVTCGSTSYTKQEIDDAVAEGCRLYAAGEQLGTSNYPHRFNNREGLTFSISGPFQEFPLLASGAVYSGGAPGPDRVVINPNYRGSCVYAGAMTHTGAPTRNGFVKCEEEEESSPSDGAGSTTRTATSTASSSHIASRTSTSATSTSDPTSTANPDDNAAGRVVSGTGGQGLVMGVVGVVAGLLLL